MLKLSIFCVFLSFFLGSQALAQKYLVLDNYGLKRKRLSFGDELYFKQPGDKALFHDYLGALKDSSVVLAVSGLEVQLTDFEAFYFRRNGVMKASTSSNFVSGGFLFAAAIEPLVSNAQYSASESALIGVAFFATGQLLKLFKWKKFKIGKNARVRVLDTTFRSE